MATSPLLMHLDTFMSIIFHLDALSITRLSQVNRSLHNDIVYNRFIWHRLVRHLIADEYLMPFTFPLDDMTTNDLRKCATRKYRLAHALIGDSLPPLHTPRRLTVEYGVDEQDDTDWTVRPGASFLVPGGRYRVDFAYDAKSSWIFVWDLRAKTELSSEGAIVIRPVTRLRLSDDAVTMFDAQADQLGDRMNISIIYEPRVSSHHPMIEVIQAVWTTHRDCPPFISRVSSLVLPAAFEYLCQLDGEDVMIHGDSPTDSTTIVWNWKTQRSLRYTNHAGVQLKILHNNTLYGVTNASSITTYPLPEQWFFDNTSTGSTTDSVSIMTPRQNHHPFSVEIPEPWQLHGLGAATIANHWHSRATDNGPCYPKAEAPFLAFPIILDPDSYYVTALATLRLPAPSVTDGLYLALPNTTDNVPVFSVRRSRKEIDRLQPLSLHYFPSTNLMALSNVWLEDEESFLADFHATRPPRPNTSVTSVLTWRLTQSLGGNMGASMEHAQVVTVEIEERAEWGMALEDWDPLSGLFRVAVLQSNEELLFYFD